MNYLGIIAKLSLGFGVTLLSLVLLGGYSWYTMHSIDKASTAVDEAFMPVVARTNQLETHVAHGIVLLKDYFVDMRIIKYTEGNAEIEMSRRLVEQILEIVDKTPKLALLRNEALTVDEIARQYLAVNQKLHENYKEFEKGRHVLSSTAEELTTAATTFLQEHMQDTQVKEAVPGSPESLPEALASENNMLDLVIEIWKLRVLVEKSSATSKQNYVRALRTFMESLLDVLVVSGANMPHTQCRTQVYNLQAGFADMFDAVDDMQRIYSQSAQIQDEVGRLSAKLLASAQDLPTQAILLTRDLARHTSQHTEDAARNLLLAACLSAILGLVIMLVVGRSIVRPLETCVNYAVQVARGDSVPPLKVRGANELSKLATAIARMVVSLEERIDQQRRMQVSLLQARGVADIAMGMTRSAAWTITPGPTPCFELTPQLLQLLGLPEDTPMLMVQDRFAAVALHNSQTAEEVRQAFVSVISGEQESCDMEYQLPRGTGETIWVREMIQAIYGPVGNGEGRILLGITQDVTAYKRQQEALEAATRAQSSFIANMSHEIRTPMNAIVGMGHLLRRTELTDLQRDYLGKIDSSGQLLLCLINDILDFSKIEAGKLHMECIDFSLQDIMNRTRSTADGLLTAKHLGFSVTVSENVPAYLQGDPYRLQQVLNNLVSNACKFTASGTVGVIVDMPDPTTVQRIPGAFWPSHLAHLSSATRLRFKVRDTGLGMSPEVQARLFKPFSQADSSITRKFGGTGLGLAICKHLVELMGGRISVTSAFDQGSTFEFTALYGYAEAPVQLEVEDSLAASLALSADPGRILLVEDNNINALIATEMLTVMGHTVDSAENGALALEKARSVHYDLILMDIQMPVMDGLTAAQAIRTNSACTNVAIVAMTAHAMDTDRIRSLESGMNDHITKPIDPEILRETVEKWLRHAV